MQSQKIWNIVLVLGMLGLYILHFTGNKKTVPADASAKEKINIRHDSMSTGLNIGYINSDTLQAKYERRKEMSKMMDGKMGSFEKDLERKMKVFQENVRVLEEEAPKMSQREIQMAQQELEMKQRELMAYREGKAQELMREESELNKLIYEEIYAVINEIREELGLDFVLMFELGGSLVAADASYDVTDEMVRRLNERHAEGKK